MEPNKEDLNRIRKEIELDDSEFRSLLSFPKFVNTFGELKGEELKTAPRGFDKEHPAIEHWHGATATTKMVHIAITKYQGDEFVRWLKPVTDEEYNEVNKLLNAAYSSPNS